MVKVRLICWWCCVCCIVLLTLCISILRARHDHNKIAPCGMINIFKLNWIEKGLGRVNNLVFYAQSTSTVISGRRLGRVNNLVFYAQSTSTVISGRRLRRVNNLVFYAQSTSTVISGRRLGRVNNCILRAVNQHGYIRAKVGESTTVWYRNTWILMARLTPGHCFTVHCVYAYVCL